MKLRLISVLLAMLLLAAAIPDSAKAETNGYTDVPEGQWYTDDIYSATKYGLMQGKGGVFGLGDNITREEFVTVLCRMFDWELINPDVPSFSDVTGSKWSYDEIETALKLDVIDIDEARIFKPGNPITREEVAVMLVRALGYKTLAQSTSLEHPFVDVTENIGYIAIASDIGMTDGITPTTFAPKQNATREQAAKMLVIIYEKYKAKTDWIHGFYAQGSYSQKDLAKDMDAISAGWSKMSFSTANGVYLATTSANNNEWHVPQQYEELPPYFAENSVKMNLNVYMDAAAMVTVSDGKSLSISNFVLCDDNNRKQAISAIVKEVTDAYKRLGYNPYNGVTIDFEGMKGPELKAGFNSFLEELSAELKSMDKVLYVMVHPKTPDGIYFDAYDYRKIGQLADKIILMAHNYKPTSMPENFLGTDYFYKHTPVTKFNEVYYALKAITNGETGVEDNSKIALAISIDSVAWELNNSKLVSTKGVNPAPGTIYKRLTGESTKGYSDLYRNPFASYFTEDGKEYFLWYEDERSVSDKLQLAKLFGIKGVSVWRIGIIPNYPDEGLYYNVWKSIIE